MSRTTEAIRCHIIPQPTIPQVQPRLQPCASKLIAEWQQRGPETLSGHGLRTLRLTLAPASAIAASAAG
jgi:hypothetical protein